MGDVWLYLRLSFALAVVLAPGFVVARALGLRGISASLAWALGIVFAGLAITFLLSASLVITLVIIIGLGLGIVDSPEPLSAEDTQALELLVKASAGSKNEYYVGKLDGKLVWDRLMRATADDRPAVAAGLTKQQAQHFIEGFGVPHADWLCVPLTEPQAEKAFEHIWTLLQDHQKKEFSTALREKCGRSIGAPAK